jgi:hypothetical protein
MNENLAWRKASYSGGTGGNCVEVADTPSAVMIRDTVDRGGVTLAVSASAWSTFLASVR